MAYWMFNPCSPCCSTFVIPYITGCQPPTGELSLFFRRIGPEIIIKKYTASPVNNYYEWTLPYSDLYDAPVNDTIAREYGTTISGWYPIHTPICTQGESSDLVISFSGSYDYYSSIGDAKYCGSVNRVSFQNLNNGPCYWGQNRANNFVVPYQSHIVTNTGVNPGTDGIKSTYSIIPEVATGTSPCYDSCNGINYPTVDVYNCKEHGGLFHYRVNQNYIRGYLWGQSEYIITDNVNYSIVDRGSGSSNFLACNANASCPIPSSIFLELRSYPNLGYNEFDNVDFKTGIEIDDIIELNFQETSGIWFGSGLNFTTHSKICCTGNPAGWADLNDDYYTYGRNYSGQETGSFDSVYLIPNIQFLSESAFDGNNASYTNFSLVLKNNKIRSFINFAPTGYLQSRCNPFVVDCRTDQPATFKLSDEYNLYPLDQWMAQVYFTDNIMLPLLSGYGAEALPSYTDGANYRGNIFDWDGGNHIGYFPYYSGYGVGKETADFKYKPPSFTEVRFNHCFMLSGYLRITE